MLAAPAAAAWCHIHEIGAELFPACRDEFGADEGEQMIARSGVAGTEQQCALVEAIDRPVVRNLASCKASEGGEEIHNRKHRVGNARLDSARPTDDGHGSDRTLAHVAECATVGPGCPDIRHI